MPVHVNTQFVFAEQSSNRYFHYREDVAQWFFGAISLKSEGSNPREYLAGVGAQLGCEASGDFWVKNYRYTSD